jgi:SpoVK/Ycf46/Vps4 family AAA+-type ATPase
MVDLVSIGEIYQKLIASHCAGDDAEFRRAARELIAEEERRNHRTLARELERLLTNGKVDAQHSAQTLRPLHLNGGAPRDKERGAELVELFEARRPIDSLVLSETARSQLDRIVSERRKAEVLLGHGLRPIAKVLFCGPPGCGKTTAAEALASQLYLPLCVVRFDAVVSSYLGETAANLRKVFEFARQRPMVLMFDEFDAIGKRRTDPDEHGELKRVVNSFLQMLDSFRGDTLTVAATNHQGLLDTALWRRFDEIVLFEKPSASQIDRLLLTNFRQLALAPAVSLAALAKSLTGLSHADVERLAIAVVKEVVLNDANHIDQASIDRALAKEHFRQDLVERTTAVPAPKPRPAKKKRRD